MEMTRRAFIGTGLMAPLILKAPDKAGTRAPVLGEGAFKYEAIHDWGELPSRIKWGNTHNVVEDSQGHIHVHHTVHATSQSGDTVVVFDRDGKFVRSWGAEFRGVAHGMWIQKEGNEEFLYLTANAANPRLQPPPAWPAAVVKATLKGEVVYRIDGPPPIAGYTVYNPTNIAIAPNGDLYVADGYGSYFINHYDRNGRYLNTFGGRGSDPGLMKEPHGIWIDTRGTEPSRTSRLRIAGTTACSASPSPASTLTSSKGSACPATSTNATALSSFRIYRGV